MTDIHKLLGQAIKDWDDAPGATLEQDLIDQHQEHPAAVELAIVKITRAHQAGKINSPWGALKAEITKQIKVRSTHNPTTQHAQRNAQQWIRTAGMHFDRWPEVEDELQRNRWPRNLEQLYNEVRPTGEQLETDELERAQRWKDTRP